MRREEQAAEPSKASGNNKGSSSSAAAAATMTALQVDTGAVQNGHNTETNIISPTTNGSSASPQQRERASTPKRRRRKLFAVSTRWEQQVSESGDVRDCNSWFCCCAKRMGNMFVLCSRPDGTPVVIAGPCWSFCLFVTVPLIVGISGAVAYFVIIDESSPLPFWIAYIYFPVIGFVLAALFCVSCQDPGLMERVRDEEAGQGGWFWNEQVGSFRPPGALYCRECGVLIQDYDHLCPWTGTGIGRKNMLAFKVFIVGVNVLCYFSMILVIVALLWGLRN
uniref:Palmitoyltransferase n=1 Tax=Craspedostauros australis TaxID=1486917 RepID=A0A7R9ZLJ7_9STRA|mmetsp:Transcript_14519/g.40050  ORF Transcript_14519/g.40050 Transcript_14519/m.40050 type:complete len:279 (+) Transcript_14519:266-1102(+)